MVSIGKSLLYCYDDKVTLKIGDYIANATAEKD
jgi:hypothetical protein